MKPFSNIAKFFHWSIAGLIVSQYILAKLAENAEHHDRVLEQLALLANHKSVGITILLLAVIRLSYRLSVSTPELPSNMLRWQIYASKVSHILLYGALFALPLSGWLMSSAKAYSVSWFNVVVLPDFVQPNDALAEQLHLVHHYLAEALFILALIHILAALKHHFIDRDDVLNRMSSKFSWILFAVVIALVVGFFGRILQAPQALVKAPKTTEVLVDRQLAASDLALWDIDYEQSYIKFIGDQAGAPFTGEWQKWSADIQFDASQIQKARFDVTIDLNSGFSGDQERDATIRSIDFFNVASFPEARYRADSFSRFDDGFQSFGTLSMKGAALDSTLDFSIVNDGNAKILKGSASLDRLRWNIGAGDWADTSWVGQAVEVEVYVRTKPAP